MYVEVITTLETRKLNCLYTYKVPEELKDLIEVGQTVIFPFGKTNRSTKGYVLEVKNEVDILEINIKNIQGIDNTKTIIDKELLKLASFIKERYFLPMASVLKLMNIKKTKVKKNINKFHFKINENYSGNISDLRKSKGKELLTLLNNEGIISFTQLLEAGYNKQLINRLLKENLIKREIFKQRNTDIILNEEQKKAYNQISASIDKEKSEVFLLKGVTGSGKTEIYFKLITECLEKGKQALVLMPEINLTEELIDRFNAAFPDNVAKWHSKISSGVKNLSLDELMNGEKNIIIGPRSAVFTRFADLGLIIVDEEHDNSYYQSTNPNYHAREVAIYRGEISQSVVVLGTATPSVDSYYKATSGDYRLIELKNKYFGQKDPFIEVVDMRNELKEGNFSVISKQLKTKINDCMIKGEKVILYLNRRGYNNFIICRDCGNVIECPDCKIPLTYHEKNNMLICHYCNYNETFHKICPECQSSRIRGIGSGTEKIVEIIKNEFPEKIIERLDSDLAGGLSRRKMILEKFKANQIDILVGTQILSKGLDFPNVSLIGIILGDITLNIPDYRSREWTFQSLMQIAGRTSRREKKGTVLLQTYQPFDIIYKDIAKFNYDSFYQKEINFRKRFNYPPFSDIFVLNLIGPDRDKVISMIWTIYDDLSKVFVKENIFRPKPSRIEKSKNKYKWQVVIKTSDKKQIETLGKLYFKHMMEMNTQYLLFIELNPLIH
ncbi:MAG: primosomal protein N' [Fusobacteria bacterium]|nr:primosomal protein N' [Fusobacteriota bacterium]